MEESRKEDKDEEEEGTKEEEKQYCFRLLLRNNVA